jgi:hypothetical protein
MHLISLYNFRRRVIRAIGQDISSKDYTKKGGKDLLVMRLIILIPLIASMHTIEIPRFPRSVLVFPIVCCGIDNIFFKVEQLFFFVEIAFGFLPVESFRCDIGATGGLWILHFRDRLSGFGYEPRGRNSTALFKLWNLISKFD